MSEARCLIVNADDFGLSPGVNRGIIESAEHGLVTSASLMVRWPALAEAAAYGREHPSFSVGLHVDLGEWEYRDGAWLALYEVVDQNDPSAVRDEVHRQLDLFQRFMGRQPTHLDSHQHVHREEGSRSVLRELAERLGIPLRHFCATVSYCGDFYGQNGKGIHFPEAIATPALLDILARLPPGVTELACHPGYASDIASMYRHERAIEVRTLCDPKVREGVEVNNIRLCSFHDVALQCN